MVRLTKMSVDIYSEIFTLIIKEVLMRLNSLLNLETVGNSERKGLRLLYTITEGTEVKYKCVLVSNINSKRCKKTYKWRNIKSKYTDIMFCII